MALCEPFYSAVNSAPSSSLWSRYAVMCFTRTVTLQHSILCCAHFYALSRECILQWKDLLELPLSAFERFALERDLLIRAASSPASGAAQLLLLSRLGTLTPYDDPLPCLLEGSSATLPAPILPADVTFTQLPRDALRKVCLSTAYCVFRVSKCDVITYCWLL